MQITNNRKLASRTLRGDALSKVAILATCINAARIAVSQRTYKNPQPRFCLNSFKSDAINLGPGTTQFQHCPRQAPRGDRHRPRRVANVCNCFKNN